MYLDSPVKYLSTGTVYSATWNFHRHILFLKVILNKQTNKPKQTLRTGIERTGGKCRDYSFYIHI